MKHYLNVCDVNGASVEPVDIITFGSPCQDLSVAGKRSGLKHGELGDGETTRSGLFMEAMRIIKEMREKTNGMHPTFAIWENVPGAFSSQKGEDFRVVLEEFVKIVEPSATMPPADKGGWPYADCYVGDGWSIAYRVIDAQYWGVPQRRRRIILIADFAGERAGKILFDSSSVSGHSAESRGKGQGAAGDAQDRTCSDDRTVCLTPEESQRRRVWTTNGASPTLDGSDGGGGRNPGGLFLVPTVAKCLRAKHSLSNREDSDTLVLTAAFSAGQSSKAGSIAYHEEIAPTLRAGASGTNQTPTIVSAVSENQRGEVLLTDMAATLSTGGGKPGRGYPCICLQGNMIGRAEKNGPQGDGINKDVSFTLNTIDIHAVCVENYPADSRVKIIEDGTYQTLTSRMGTGGGNTPMLLEKSHDATRYIVRRLTPTECTRLQGFPDWWGELPTITSMSDEEYNFWCADHLELAKIGQTARWDELTGSYIIWREVKPDKKKGENFAPHWENTGKPYKSRNKEQMMAWYNKLHCDGAEYTMWGNGVALPVVRVPLHGMAKRGAQTLGSLFDGSGGFPLAGLLEGITPLWASEIASYPIAVTRYQFDRLLAREDGTNEPT